MPGVDDHRANRERDELADADGAHAQQRHRRGVGRVGSGDSLGAVLQRGRLFDGAGRGGADGGDLPALDRIGRIEDDDAAADGEPYRLDRLDKRRATVAGASATPRRPRRPRPARAVPVAMVSR
ncbi:hypothetical protein ABT352_38710 [Streptosporangium sp. NPDC000563]|uniref:hypothetical protein n=1 Tax=Streptosporangium sp. NPDC000563 TaxID=3154366 RepID=UPI00331D3D3C